MVEGFESKLAIHGDNWDGLNGGDERRSIYSQSREKIKDEVLFIFYVLYSEVIFGKPSFEVEELFVRKQFVFKIKNPRKGRIIHIDKKSVAEEIEFKLFDTIFDC